MPSPLICARCDTEIVPGTAVEFVGDVDVEERRIFTSDDVLVVHAACPDPTYDHDRGVWVVGARVLDQDECDHLGLDPRGWVDRCAICSEPVGADEEHVDPVHDATHRGTLQ